MYIDYVFANKNCLKEYLSESKSSGKSLVVKSFQILVSAIQANISIVLLFLLLHLSLMIYNYLGNLKNITIFYNLVSLLVKILHQQLFKKFIVQ